MWAGFHSLLDFRQQKLMIASSRLMSYRKFLNAAAALLIGVVVLNCASVEAATLYAATSAGAPGELYTLDPTTGAMVSDIGPLNDLLSVNYPITGLAFNPITGVLYGSTGNAGSVDAMLVTINPATALVTPIGFFNAGPTNTSGTPSTMADLAFDATGNLYGVGSIGGPQLYSINILTGQATVIGSTGLGSTTGGGLAIIVHSAWSAENAAGSQSTRKERLRLGRCLSYTGSQLRT